eukprot:8211128-Pyramimonas_sp.AAC.1
MSQCTPSAPPSCYPSCSLALHALSAALTASLLQLHFGSRKRKGTEPAARACVGRRASLLPSVLP